MTQPRNNLPPAVVLPETLIHREGRVIPGQFAGEMGPTATRCSWNSAATIPRPTGPIPNTASIMPRAG